MPQDDRSRAERLIEEFETKLEYFVSASNVPRRVIRPLVTGSIICGSFSDTYFVGYTPQLGVPTITFIQLQAAGRPSIETFHSFLADRTGQEFAVVELQGAWLSLPETQREANVASVAIQLMQAELSRTKVKNTMIPFSPIFGQNIYPIQEKLVFTLMPFTTDLTAIYNGIVKPVIEAKGLVSRRADDISSNNAIMQDIWRNICEARFIIADITGRNPNVMYELGIAHTVGKEVILIHQIGDAAPFPFDIAHVRVITYENNVIGADVLKKKVDTTIDSVLQKLAATSLVR